MLEEADTWGMMHPYGISTVIHPTAKSKTKQTKMSWSSAKSPLHGFDVFATPPKILASRHGEENRQELWDA